MFTRRSVLLAALVALALTAAPPAHAQHHGKPTLHHYVFDDGTGQLIANPAGHPVTWERCAPEGSPCTTYDDGDANPQFLSVRDDPPGTAFTATQDGVTSRSEIWRGRVRATAPPRVDGEIRVGGLVAPVPATWEGGWGREADWLQLQACRTAQGADCVVILDSIKFGRCRPDGGRLLPARYEGSWLRVTDTRIDREQPFTLEGYTAPEYIRPNVPGPPAVAGAVVGQIASGPAPVEDCGQQPLPRPPQVPRCRDLAQPASQQGPAGPTTPYPAPTAPPARPAPRVPPCTSPLRVSRVVLTRARLSLHVSRAATVRVRLARRTARPGAAKWRPVRSVRLRAQGAGRVTRRLGRLRRGRYRISIRAGGAGGATFERTLRRTLKR